MGQHHPAPSGLPSLSSSRPECSVIQQSGVLCRFCEKVLEGEARWFVTCSVPAATYPLPPPAFVREWGKGRMAHWTPGLAKWCAERQKPNDPSGGIYAGSCLHPHSRTGDSQGSHTWCPAQIWTAGSSPEVRGREDSVPRLSDPAVAGAQETLKRAVRPDFLPQALFDPG